MRKLKLFHLEAGINLGGTEIMLLRYLDRVERTCFQVAVGALFNNGRLIDEVRKKRFVGVSFGIKRRWNLIEVIWAFYKLYLFLKRNKIDIIQLYGFYTNILGRIVARLARIPVVITGLRTEKFWRNRFHSLLARATANWTDSYISVSEKGKELMLRKKWIKKDKVMVIANGIDINWATCQRLKTLPHKVGMIAAFNQFKAQKELVLAATRILKKFPEAKFILVGEGKTKRYVIKLIKNLGLKNNFDLIGYTKDVRQILAQLSVFVLTTNTEGLPVTILEAMAFGLPVVASNVGGIPELVEDRITGILVRPGCPEELAEAIIELLASPEKAKRMGEMGRLRVQKLFTIEPMMQKLESHYLALAKRKGLLNE